MLLAAALLGAGLVLPASAAPSLDLYQDGSTVSPEPPLGSASPIDVTPLVDIREARADEDDDTLPDRMGDTLSVVGRASIGTGALDDPRVIYLQDDEAGLAVRLPDRGPGVAVGDSLYVTGTLDQDNGLTTLRVLRYTVFDVPRVPPPPTVITIQDALSDTYEGMLAHINGQIVGIGSNKGGEYLLLGDGVNDEALLAVFVSRVRSSSIQLSDFEEGDRVEVTGLVSQHDYSRPYRGYYEMLPRTQGDISLVGIDGEYYRNALLAISIVFLLAIGVVVLLRAEVKRRTRQLAESQQRFQRLVEATFEGIVIHRDGRILDVNDAIVTMVGIPRHQLIGQDALSFLSPSSRDVAARHIRTGTEQAYEATLIRADGTSFPAEIVGKNVYDQGTSTRVAAIRDITKRKQDEEELLRAKEEAEQVAQLKSSLINNMSHELRTPITSILGYAELIMEEPPEMHTRFAERIHQSGKRLSDTLRLVLEMAQMEAGTIDLSVSPVDVDGLVEDVVDEHRTLAQEGNVDVSLDVEPAEVDTDRRAVYRITSNLIHNAIKFAPGGDVHVAVRQTGDAVRLDVTDTGVGISEGFLPDLFTPFKQESNGSTRDFDGTGLGLTITKRMVDLIDATLVVNSQKGEGSTFSVTFPPCASAAVLQSPSASDTHSNGVRFTN